MNPKNKKEQTPPSMRRNSPHTGGLREYLLLSPIKTGILAVLLLFFLYSLYFMYLSYKTNTGISISDILFCLYTFFLFAVSALLAPLKKFLQRLYTPFVILFYGGAAAFMLSFGVFCVLILNYSAEEIPDDIDTVVVLGCHTFGMTPGNSLKSRLDKTVEFLNEYEGVNNVAVIVSGGQGADETVPEAKAMQAYLINKGIETGKIHMEAESHSTFQNLTLTKKLIAEKNIKADKIVIITNEYHVPRSLMIAGRLGFEAYAVSAPTPKNMFASGVLREYCAWFKSFVVDRK